MSIIMDSISSFINAKQKENESLHNYARRFKTLPENTDFHKSQLSKNYNSNQYQNQMRNQRRTKIKYKKILT